MAFASHHSNVLVSSAPFLTSNTQVDVFALYTILIYIYIFIYIYNIYSTWMTPTLANSTWLSLPHTWQKLLKSRMACRDARGACKTISTNQPFDDQPLDTINLSVISFSCRCYKRWTASTGIFMILNWFACILSITVSILNINLWLVSCHLLHYLGFFHPLKLHGGHLGSHVVLDHRIGMCRPHSQHDVRKDIHLSQPQILQAPIQSLTWQHGHIEGRTPGEAGRESKKTPARWVWKMFGKNGWHLPPFMD